MSRFGTQYQVARSTGVCAASGKPLEPGSACVAALCERPEDEGFERLDYAVDAWEQGVRPEGLFSFWKTVVVEPGTRRRLFVDDEVLVDLFLRLADDEQPRRIAFRFVLALILMRKKVLKFVGRTTPATGCSADHLADHLADPAADEKPDPRPERWLMKLRGTPPEDAPLEVENPQLEDEDVRELTAQLSEILQGEF